MTGMGSSQSNDAHKEVLDKKYDVPFIARHNVCGKCKQTMWEYLAGVIDGDGWFSVYYDVRPQYYHRKIKFQIGISQACNSGVPILLKHVLEWFGGHITLGKARTNKKRDCWHWKLTNLIAIRRFLKHLIPLLALKYNHAHLMLTMLNCNCLTHKQCCPECRKRLSIFRRMKTPNYYSTVAVDSSRLTPAYVSGLFEAEGCVKWGNGLYANIAQGSAPHLLHAIKETFGCGSVYPNVWQLCGQNAEDFLRLVLPLLRGKYSQALAGLNLRSIQQSNRRKQFQAYSVEHQKSFAYWKFVIKQQKRI